MEKIKSKRADLLVGFALALMVWAVFGQTVKYEFVNYDDDVYVYENPIVLQGFTSENIKQIFSPEKRGGYYPLTMFSFMLDREIHGMDAGGFHLGNVLLHMATSIALFLVLRSMTGSLWRSAFVAAIFAIHPLRAESVAWVTERKDVLSGLFFMLTLGAYGYYTRRPFSIIRYLSVCLFFALGLLAKPMLITLPFLLLLLDVWPLCRFENSPAAAGRKRLFTRIIIEKIPLFLFSVLAGTMTLGSHAKLENTLIPLQWRIGNALVSYIVYIKQIVWPSGLAALYPWIPPPFWQIIVSLFLLGTISLIVLPLRRKYPYLFTGWLWYLGMLVPVIGITRVLLGAAHADRFTYLPQIGLYIILAWGVSDLSAWW